MAGRYLNKVPGSAPSLVRYTNLLLLDLLPCVLDLAI